MRTTKIVKKLILFGSVITILSFLITGLTCKFWDTKENMKEQNPIIKLTKLKNGRWISTTDSLAGIEIKNGKWIMFYKGMKTDSSNIYDYQITRKYSKDLSEKPNPIEYLKLTNQSDTLDYAILECSLELISLSYIPRGNTLHYKPE
jgi:hypothetical protein